MKNIPTVKFAKTGTEFNKLTITLKEKGIAAKKYSEVIEDISKGIKAVANKGNTEYSRSISNIEPRRIEIVKEFFETIGYEVSTEDKDKSKTATLLFSW